MAKVVYPKAFANLLKGNFVFKTSGGSTFKVVLVDAADYTYSASHETLADVPSAARVATATLTLIADPTAGTVDFNDYTFSAVTGDPSEAVILYKDSGVESTSYLVWYDDAATGLPVTPNGGDIAGAFDNGSNKVWTIS